MASISRSLLARGYATAAAVKVSSSLPLPTTPQPTLTPPSHPHSLYRPPPSPPRQPPVQLTSLSGTYATSTYLAALKKSEKELDSVAQGLAAMEKKLKEDGKVAQSLSEWGVSLYC